MRLNTFGIRGLAALSFLLLAHSSIARVDHQAIETEPASATRHALSAAPPPPEVQREFKTKQTQDVFLKEQVKFKEKLKIEVKTASPLTNQQIRTKAFEFAKTHFIGTNTDREHWNQFANWIMTTPPKNRSRSEVWVLYKRAYELGRDKGFGSINSRALAKRVAESPGGQAVLVHLLRTLRYTNTRWVTTDDERIRIALFLAEQPNPVDAIARHQAAFNAARLGHTEAEALRAANLAVGLRNAR